MGDQGLRGVCQRVGIDRDNRNCVRINIRQLGFKGSGAGLNTCRFGETRGLRCAASQDFGRDIQGLKNRRIGLRHTTGANQKNRRVSRHY